MPLPNKLTILNTNRIEMVEKKHYFYKLFKMLHESFRHDTSPDDIRNWFESNDFNFYQEDLTSSSYYVHVLKEIQNEIVYVEINWTSEDECNLKIMVSGNEQMTFDDLCC